MEAMKLGGLKLSEAIIHGVRGLSTSGVEGEPSLAIVRLHMGWFMELPSTFFETHWQRLLFRGAVSNFMWLQQLQLGTLQEACAGFLYTTENLDLNEPPPHELTADLECGMGDLYHFNV